MTASRTARERVRAELTREIVEIARRQLATEGAGGLSLRAVAREMGMVSSAIYRYFPSRDDLLTTLIIDGYNALGEAVERADAAAPEDDFPGRWAALCHAVRDWALAHPHEYALLYGSPVPGYQAPQDTIGPRVRDLTVFGAILSAAQRAGALTPPATPFEADPALAGEAEASLADLMPGVPGDALLRALSAWTSLYGWVSFEVFGQFKGAFVDLRPAFDHSVRALGAMIGLTRG
ncbi:TetR/AcrR family transcriptional regulator [Nonomuraea rhodomycinica]|uniref:TetR/AcrR family transcriptional regulator n=1 Tax=Nonomuraea rhodomycinica TaxID=1712872 RepID=A0A7Y6IL86_9ACTN|nr:TetR/AcrR family transcriptional regulator [Nonomuraea rhodomycinica]NUW40327.1 TetR/AcrR family transcriptional regulator [Nonomuraea rhodomycinica]